MGQLCVLRVFSSVTVAMALKSSTGKCTSFCCACNTLASVDASRHALQRTEDYSCDPSTAGAATGPYGKPLPMALNSAAQALKAGVLRHIRLPLQHAYGASTSGSAALSLSLWRGFAGGGYLDKDDVTQRVLDVTKHFEKIEPAKVRVCRCAARAESTPASK